VYNVLHSIWTVLIALSPIMGVALVVFTLEQLFPRRQVRVDPFRWITAWAIVLCGWTLINLATPLAVLISAELARRNNLGLLIAVHAPLWFSAAIGLLAIDLSHYVAHWTMHKVPVLWRVHSVHHSDDHLDASTALLFHPLEQLTSAAVSGTMVVLIGAPPIAVAIGYGLQLLLNFWQHANIRIAPYQDRLAAVLVTPELHRLHHSADRELHDKNFGLLFVLWDWAFGTLHRAPHRDEDLCFGLDRSDWDLPRTLTALLAAPFRTIRRHAPTWAPTSAKNYPSRPYE
jgi:sterol desaturase/sphingolipid hydroxylase (fatty acid hydroxylase superfamily)